jgi:hypothetical protein
MLTPACETQYLLRPLGQVGEMEPPLAGAGPGAAEEARLFSAARQPEVGWKPRDWSNATPGGLIPVYRALQKMSCKK